jgi:hypothetical protein
LVALGALALGACAREHTDRDRDTAGGRSPLAQFESDAGYGLPNPMPGSPIADGGITPYTPPPPSAAPGSPLPSTPGVPDH